MSISAEPKKVECFCDSCAKDTEHYDINPALKICSICGNEIHGSDAVKMRMGGVKMSEKLNSYQHNDIRRLWQKGVPPDEIARTYGKSIWTIRGICKGTARGKAIKSERLPAVGVGQGPVVKRESESGVIVEIRLRISAPIPAWPPSKDLADRYRMELESILRQK